MLIQGSQTQNRPVYYFTYMEFKNRQNQSIVIKISIVVVILVGVERMTEKHRKHLDINKYIQIFKIPCAVCKRLSILLYVNYILTNNI